MLGRLAACCFLVLAATLSGCAATHRNATLKDAYAGRFLIGTACDPSDYSAAEQANIKANYNVITPENCMKPGPIHPAEDQYNFGPPDTLVQWCQDNHIQVIGHNLCWHAETGNWFFQGPDGGTVSRDLLMERFRSHIMTVVGRYKGRIKGWDVVNEAINDGGAPSPDNPENLRSTNWLRIIGPEYLTMAFKWAHQADPGAELYYNDYNIESGSKHASSMALLKRLMAEGAPVTGVGIQGHWDSHPNIPVIEKAIKDYKSLGLKVMITELDITISGGNSGALTGAGASGGTQPATPAAAQPSGPPAQLSPLERQAQAYSQLFELFDRYPGTITRVTFWGINDARSWRSGQRPLLFDGQMQPKPAYQAVLDAALHRENPFFVALFGGRHDVASAKSGGESSVPVAAKFPMRIKAGLDQPFVDSQGVRWEADLGFDGGQMEDRTSSLDITSQDRPELFKTERYFDGPTGAYHFKVPNGSYVVKLYFSEGYNGNRSPDARRFTYDVRDGDASGKVAKEVKDFSPWAAAGGPAKGYIDTIPITVRTGQITIAFSAQVEHPQINAIEVVKQ